VTVPRASQYCGRAPIGKVPLEEYVSKIQTDACKGIPDEFSQDITGLKFPFVQIREEALGSQHYPFLNATEVLEFLTPLTRNLSRRDTEAQRRAILYSTGETCFVCK
jgi:hypothetical protein